MPVPTHNPPMSHSERYIGCSSSFVSMCAAPGRCCGDYRIAGAGGKRVARIRSDRLRRSPRVGGGLGLFTTETRRTRRFHREVAPGMGAAGLRVAIASVVPASPERKSITPFRGQPDGTLVTLEHATGFAVG